MPASAKRLKGGSPSFLLKAIEILDVSMSHPTEVADRLDMKNYTIKIEHRIPDDQPIIGVIINVEILNEEKAIKLASLTANCVFEIENMYDFRNSLGMLVLPEEFLITLNSITISTTRGIMFTLFRGTFLHNAILPIVDPSQMEKVN